MAGSFTVVGIGPGDPELITIKAARIIGAADVVAFHAGVRKQSHARRIAADLIPAGAIEEELRYPVTTGSTDHPGGYVGALADFYEACATRLGTHLDAGRDVVLLAEGDPLFYGSSMYLHDRFKEVHPTSVVPGVPAFAAATATIAGAAGPLVRQSDVLTVLAGTLPEPELARRLADTDGAVIMKLGRTFPAVRAALAAAGRLEGAWYVERASQPEERWLPVADVDPDSVPYFSLIVVPGDSGQRPSAERLRAGLDTTSNGGRVASVSERIETLSAGLDTPALVPHAGYSTSNGGRVASVSERIETPSVGLDMPALVPHAGYSTSGGGRVASVSERVETPSAGLDTPALVPHAGYSTSNGGRVASVSERIETPSAGLDTPALVPHAGYSTSNGGRVASVSERIETPSTTGRAELLVVGLGPGPDCWLTPETTDALASVDHIVGYAPYLARVPQRAGLQRHASGNTVEVDRARFALGLARAGERVAVVSGGDAGVFGMASAVFEAAEDPAFGGVAIRVLPGLSAVQAVAARAGAPIGADFAVVSLSDRLKPWPVVAGRLHAIAEADLVLAVYNPRSRSRTTQVAEMQQILLAHRKPDTVVVVGRDVGRAEESLTVTTLAELDPGSIDMKCLLIIGASSTRVTEAGQVWTPRFVEGYGR